MNWVSNEHSEYRTNTSETAHYEAIYVCVVITTIRSRTEEEEDGSNSNNVTNCKTP